MHSISSLALSRHSYTAHLRALYHDVDDTESTHHRLRAPFSALDNSQLDISKDDSDRSSQHSAASNDSIDNDQPYYTLIANITQSPKPPHTTHSTTTPTTTPIAPPTPPAPSTATLPPTLWPIACDIFEHADRLHHASHSPSAHGSASSGMFSFLNVLTAHTDVTSAMRLSSTSTSLLFSFLVALHRLSLQLGEVRVDWWRLLQAAWVRQCRQDDELRRDDGIRRRLEVSRLLTMAAEDTDEVKEDGRSSVVQREWQRLQAAEKEERSQVRHLRSKQESAPVSRKRKYSPLSSAAIELLKLHFQAWRADVVDQRSAPEVVRQANSFYCHTMWQRWRTAVLLHRADRQRLRADRQQLSHATRAWTQWSQGRRLSHAAVRLAQRHCQLFTQSLCLGRWMAALHEARDERHQLQTAVQHHKQLCLPTSLQRWKQYADVKHRLHSDVSTMKAWRCKRLAMDTLSVWRRALHSAAQCRTEAAGRLRPLRLRHAVRIWQRTVKHARSAVVCSGPFLHAAFRWLHLSLNYPLPFTTSPLPSSTLILRPTRQQSHVAMQQVWQRWQLQRFQAAWRHVVAQHKTERVKLSHLQRLRTRRLLDTAWQRWKQERERRERRKMNVLKQALDTWQQRAMERKVRREQLQTALLVHKFNTQRGAFHVWAQYWQQCEQQRREKDRQSKAQQQREEHEALIERQMQEQADAFHHSRLLPLCIVQWHSYAVHSLATSCTLSLASSHHSIVCKQWAVQRWQQWQQQRKQCKAELQSLADRADVMYVGRLLSVMLVCWRVQLARKQSLSVMAEKREQRALHERWQQWQMYVQSCQQKRRQQRDEEERQKREDDQRKAELIVRSRLQSVWAVWRRRMAVVAVGQQLAEKRHRDRMLRAMHGWWEAARQKKQLAEARRSKLRQLLYAYLRYRQDAAGQRVRSELILYQQATRKRLTAIFAVWKEGGLRRLDKRRHDTAQSEQMMARRALLEWHAAVQRRKQRVSEATVAVEHMANVGLLTASLKCWRRTLHLRASYERLYGRLDEAEADMQITAFAYWRHHCITVAWRVWRTESIERRLHRQAEKQYRSVALTLALSRWRGTARQTKQQRQLSALMHLNSKRALFARWRQALAVQRHERRAAESLQLTLSVTSLPFVRPLLLSILRPQLPSQLALEWFHRWRAYVAHRQQRLQMTTAAYQLYHHNLLTSAFVLMLSHYRMAAATTLYARSRTRQRLSSAVQHWHRYTQQHHTARTVAQLSSVHYNSRLVSAVLSAWRQQSKRGAARRSRCAEIERGVDALVVRSAFHRWHTAAVGERRRQRMFTLSHCFLVWKWQTVRLRERRQLLEADSRSSIAPQAVAVDVG